MKMIEKNDSLVDGSTCFQIFPFSLSAYFITYPERKCSQIVIIKGIKKATI